MLADIQYHARLAYEDREKADGSRGKFNEAKLKQARKRYERLIEQMKQAQGITERLKAENALEWIGRMNTKKFKFHQLLLFGQPSIIYTAF